MLPDKFVVIDLETTGLDPERHRIIEIAALKVEGGEVKDLYQTLVNPGVPLPFYIQKLTGIDEKMLSLAPDLDRVLPVLWDLVKGLPVVGHNISFDLAFLCRAFNLTSWPYPYFDTFPLCRIIYPRLSSYSLESLSRFLDLKAEAHHRALADAHTTLELFLRLWQDTLSLEKELLRRMLHLSPPPLRPWFEGALSSSPTLCAEAAASAFNPAREGPILQERKDVPPTGEAALLDRRYGFPLGPRG